MKRALDAVIDALGRSGSDAIDLLVGEPCFEPPVEILAAFEQVAGSSAADYGPPTGLAEVRTVIAGSVGGSVAKDNVVVTHGGKGALLALFATLVEPGDEVIHPIPCYPAYPAMVRRLGGVPVSVPETETGFGGWSAAVDAAITERTRVVVLSSPSNPSGSVLGDDERTALADRCASTGITLVLDEAYAAFRFDRVADETEVDGAVVRVRSASKALALCGWRIGWVVADEALAARVAAAQTSLLNPPATPPQRALLALPEVPVGYFERNRRAVQERVAAVASAFRSAGAKVRTPQGGFYVWADLRNRVGGDGDSVSWCVRLAAERGVGLWPGEDFGAPGWVRAALPRGDGWREIVAEFEGRLNGFV
jgi:aspartate aminotransferase